MLVQVTGRGSRARRVGSLFALGVTIAIGGCSAASSSKDDDDVGSPGGTFVSPHADAAEESSPPEEAGEEYDAEAPHDARAIDAAAPHDARPADAQTQAPDAGVVQDAAPTGCMSAPIPADAGTFYGTLPTVTPMTGGDGGSACGAGQLTEFSDDCFGSSSSAAACNTWFPGGGGSVDQQTCASCIEGVTIGSGAVISIFPSEPREVTANQVACILALDPSPAGVACAQDLLDLTLCSAVSCASCTSDGMGGGTDPDGTLLEPCEVTSDEGACASYLGAANDDCSDLDAGGAAAACNAPNGAAFQPIFLTYAMVLCGGS